jgi:hypothetical protein
VPALPATRGASVRVHDNLQSFCNSMEYENCNTSAKRAVNKFMQDRHSLPLLNNILGICSIIRTAIALACE